MYEAELLRAGAGDAGVWQTQLRPVLAVLAVADAGPNTSLPPASRGPITGLPLAGAGPILSLPLTVAASARLGGPRTANRLRDVVVRLSGLIVRSHPGQPDELLRLLHISLAEDYLLRPDSQFGIDPIEAHAALAEATAEYLGEYLSALSVALRDMERNIRQLKPMSPGELSVARNFFEQLIDDLPKVIGTAPKWQALISSLADAGYDLLAAISIYATLVNRYFDDKVQEDRLNRSLSEVRLEFSAILDSSKVVKGKMVDYIEKVQLAIELSSH